jgi:hypothetical protein
VLAGVMKMAAINSMNFATFALSVFLLSFREIKCGKYNMAATPVEHTEVQQIGISMVDSHYNQVTSV